MSEYQESWTMETLMANEASAEANARRDTILRVEFDANRVKELETALENIGHVGLRMERTMLYSGYNRKHVEMATLKLAQQLINEVRRGKLKWKAIFIVFCGIHYI